MRRMTGLTLASLIGAVLGSAAVSQTSTDFIEEDLRRMHQRLAGRQAGSPVGCIQQNQIISTDLIGDRTILYRMRGGLIYRNDLPGGCPGLRRGNAFQVRTPITRFCRGDIGTVQNFAQNFTFGSCALGDFVPYRKDR